MTNIVEPRAHISLVGFGQIIKPQRWTRIVVAGEDVFTMIRGDCDFDLQGYADFGTVVDGKLKPGTAWPMAERPTTWQTMTHRLDGTPGGNVSSRLAVAVPPIYNFAWRYVVNGFQTEPKKPLTFDVWHDADRDVTLRETVLKLHVTRAE